MDSGKLEQEIEKAVAIFNKYRSPEAHAKFMSWDDGSFSIIFTGPFCRSCGYHDYFDDFRIFLEEIGILSEINDIKEAGETNIVRFKICEN